MPAIFPQEHFLLIDVSSSNPVNIETNNLFFVSLLFSQFINFSRPLSSITTSAPSTSAPTTFSTTTIIQTTTPLPVLLAANALSDDKKPLPSPYGTPLKVVIDNMSTEGHVEDDKSEENESTSENTSSQLNNIDEVESDQDDFNEQSRTDDKIIEEIPEQSEEIEEDASERVEETTSVEQRLRKITEEIEKYSSLDNESEMHGRQSFLTLTDLIKTLQPTGKKIAPQIDSDYSKSMHVLGEMASIVNSDESRKIKDYDLRQTNRALY